ncbi:hypothetical protein ACIQZM_18755, partial [Peribacillus sp. NPDC097206]|uniref:hypothetical protein n=1 Tax=Peribacillus sp. NPDC097206 TaxID=3364398 RepID=UPI003829DD31
VNYYRNRKTGGEKQLVFLHLFYFRDLLDSPFFVLFNNKKPCSMLSRVNGMSKVNRLKRST